MHKAHTCELNEPLKIHDRDIILPFCSPQLFSITRDLFSQFAWSPGKIMGKKGVWKKKMKLHAHVEFGDSWFLFALSLSRCTIPRLCTRGQRTARNTWARIPRCCPRCVYEWRTTQIMGKYFKWGKKLCLHWECNFRAFTSWSNTFSKNDDWRRLNIFFFFWSSSNLLLKSWFTLEKIYKTKKKTKLVIEWHTPRGLCFTSGIFCWL